MPRYSAECTYRKTFDFDAKDDAEAREILDRIHGSVGLLDHVYKDLAAANIQGYEPESEIEEFKNADTSEAVAVEVEEDA